MNLNEAIKTLNEAGFLVETTWAVKRRFYSIAELRKSLSANAIACHESAQYDEYEQEPYCDTDAIEEITDEQFVKWMIAEGFEDGLDQFINVELDEKTYDNLARAWSDVLYGEALMGWNYTWNNQ
jgi:hypothetical protein